MEEARFFHALPGKQVLLEMGLPDMDQPGDSLARIQPNSAEACADSHLPSVQYNNGSLYVHVGENPHPMTEGHYIQWIYIHSTRGGQFRILQPASPAEAEFTVYNDRVLGVYAYCNLHGLWRLDGSNVIVFPDIARPPMNRSQSPDSGRGIN